MVKVRHIIGTILVIIGIILLGSTMTILLHDYWARTSAAVFGFLITSFGGVVLYKKDW